MIDNFGERQPSRAEVIGWMHLLWHWALEYAEDGDLGPFTDQEIAAAAEWPGNAELFVRALHDATNLGADLLDEREADDPADPTRQGARATLHHDASAAAAAGDDGMADPNQETTADDPNKPPTLTAVQSIEMSGIKAQCRGLWRNLYQRGINMPEPPDQDASLGDWKAYLRTLALLHKPFPTATATTKEPNA